MHAALFLLRKPRKRRSKRTRYGAKAQSKHSEKNASRKRQPWLLAAAPDLRDWPAKRIIGLYRRRMQISALLSAKDRTDASS